MQPVRGPGAIRGLPRPRTQPKSMSWAPQPVDRVEVSGFDQASFQHNLLDHLGQQFARVRHTFDCSQVSGRIPQQQEVQAKFAEVANRPELPFGYIRDGCCARAHLVCHELEKADFKQAKMFVMVEDEGSGDLLRAKNEVMATQWHYHVAPLVLVHSQDGQRVEPLMIDPSLADQPLPPEDWIRSMWNGQFPIKIDITHKGQYLPLWENSVPKQPPLQDSLYTAWMECKLHRQELAQLRSQPGP